ncbi:TonB-dependent receptor plug domain-containing protein [Pedobacter jeongneungensis]|uniref:TonB-dependent receptor plug domain-containing protein n=1 Tax=Pedobacter jeongneungensis TaxID=947309 RepID=UPI00046A2B75|nr:TonB-dependent receptor plug domain-containing protein [Pedobacter jeongneungensis]
MRTLFTFTLIIGISLAGFAQKADSTKTPRITLRGVSTSGTEPLIVIDGNKQYVRGASLLSEMESNIESITVLKDSSAVAKYGSDGFAGVIEVKTKTKQVWNYDFKATPKQIGDVPLKGKVTGFSVRPQSSTAKDGDSNFSVTKNGIKLKNGKAAPLYIIDGKEASGTETLDKESIESVEIIKDASGTSGYGEKAKNGVIIITTKKAKTNPKKN